MSDLKIIEMNSAEGCGVVEELLKNGSNVHLCVTGSSMMPFLAPNRDVVVLRSCKDDSFKFGQILLFKRSDGRLVLHRIRKIKGNTLTMNGDSQVWCESIHKEQAVACVAQVIKNGKCIEAESVRYKLWAILWYPTRPIRLFMKKIRNAFKLRRR